MQAALFSSVPYGAPIPQRGWPVSGKEYSAEVAQASMERAIEQFVLADQVGFDWVTVAEHHYAPWALTPNPMIMAAAVAQRVKRAKIALLGSNIPIQNPVRVAEEFAMLDVLTGGRLIAGMLRGTSNEYVTYGINPGESRERFAEALELIVACWTEPEPFGWVGRYYEYRTISIWPRPVQAPHPPIYMSISSPESAEFAAEHKVNAGFAVTSVPLAKTSVQLYREAANAKGWDPKPEQILYRIACHLTDTEDEAYEDLTPREGPSAQAGALSTANKAIDEAAARAGFYGRDVEHQRGRVHAGGDLKERVATGRILLGSPDSVFEQVASVRRELGAGVLEVIFAAPTAEKARRGIELFGEKVLPRMAEL